MYVRVPEGCALIRNGLGGRRLFFGGALVIPILHKAEFVDLTTKKITISRTGKEGVSCRDGIRADLTMDFFVRIIEEPKTVLEVSTRSGLVSRNAAG